MLWEHHSKLLGRVLPPLESAELERLERLARGLETPKPPKRKALTELPLPKDAKPHKLTIRYKRRMWKRVLEKSSKLEFDETKGGWKASFSPFVKGPNTTIGELTDFEGMSNVRGGGKLGPRMAKKTEKIKEHMTEILSST